MYNNENPAQGIHAQRHEARFTFCYWVGNSDTLLVAKRLLCMSEAHTVLAKVR